jgi:ankyrin repeat protein
MRLIVASQTGHAEVAEKLLADGVNPNAVNGTNSALIIAIRSRKPAVVKVLLSHGANANLAAGTGITPLSWAVRTGDLELIKALVQAGADPDRRNKDGTTAADEARNSPEILLLLSLRPR